MRPGPPAGGVEDIPDTGPKVTIEVFLGGRFFAGGGCPGATPPLPGIPEEGGWVVNHPPPELKWILNGF